MKSLCVAFIMWYALIHTAQKEVINIHVLFWRLMQKLSQTSNLTLTLTQNLTLTKIKTKQNKMLKIQVSYKNQAKTQT